MLASDCKALPLALVVVPNGFGVRFCGRDYWKVIQQLFDLNKSAWVGATSEAAVPVGAWLYHFAHVLFVSVWLHLTLDVEWVGNLWLQAGAGKEQARFNI